VKVLVTGGAGFIGSHIVHWLRRAGYEVVTADNLRTGKRTNLPADVPLYELDIRDQSGLADLFAAERPEAVVHQAALANVRESMEDPITYAEVNIIGTLHLLELVKDYNCSKFIFASTGGAVYGEGQPPKESTAESDRTRGQASGSASLPFTEESLPQPKDNYGANKLSCEHYIELYNQNYGLPYVILRYANVYGPRQDAKGEAGVVAIFSGAMLADHATYITGDGGQQRFRRPVGHGVLSGIRPLRPRGSVPVPGPAGFIRRQHRRRLSSACTGTRGGFGAPARCRGGALRRSWCGRSRCRRAARARRYRWPRATTATRSRRRRPAR